MIRKIKWLVLLFLIPGTGLCQGINWQDYTLGMEKARAENKKVFLQFKADWCSACVYMEKNTFGNDGVIRYLNDHFISIAIDGDKQTELRKKYRVKGYPSNFFLDPTGRMVYSRPGALEPDVFMFFLEYVQSESYKSMSPMEYYRKRQI